MKIKLIIFDAGGVLYKNVSKQVILNEFKKFIRSLGYEPEKDPEIVWNKLHALGREGKITPTKFIKLLFEEVGIPINLMDQWLRSYKNLWKTFGKTENGVNEILQNLKTKGYKLAILTDYIGPKRRKISQLRLANIEYQLFDEIFTSYELGYAKPKKEAYLKVLEHFKCKPEETIFVGDEEDEIEGAKRLGILTIGYKCRCGDYQVKNMKELLELLPYLEE